MGARRAGLLQPAGASGVRGVEVLAHVLHGVDLGVNLEVGGTEAAVVTPRSGNARPTTPSSGA
jgi:hypothetical protein